MLPIENNAVDISDSESVDIIPGYWLKRYGIYNINIANATIKNDFLLHVKNSNSLFFNSVIFENPFVNNNNNIL